MSDGIIHKHCEPPAALEPPAAIAEIRWGSGEGQQIELPLTPYEVREEDLDRFRRAKRQD